MTVGHNEAHLPFSSLSHELDTSKEGSYDYEDEVRSLDKRNRTDVVDEA